MQYNEGSVCYLILVFNFNYKLNYLTKFGSSKVVTTFKKVAYSCYFLKQVVVFNYIFDKIVVVAWNKKVVFFLHLGIIV